MAEPQMNDLRGMQPRMPVDDGMSRPVQPVGYHSASFSSEPYQPAGYGDYPAQGDYVPAGQPMWQEDTYPPVQDWQQPAPPYQPPMQQTGPQPWSTGPVMPLTDPFGETRGVDVSLARERSQNVYEHKGPFWDSPDQVHRKNRKDKQQVEKRPGSHAGSHAAQRILLTLMILAVIGAVLYGTVLRVRTISVEGNVNISDEEIIRLAGIGEGSSILAVDEQSVKAGVNSSHYLIFDSVDKQLPSAVTITVKERTPAAVMNYCGINYIIDNKGMVLAESEDVDAYTGLPELSGMDLVGVYGAAVGRKLNVNSNAQLAAMSNILIELRVLSAEREVTKVKLSNLSQLLLETREGYSVNLGTYERIHEKLKAMLYIKKYLNQNGASEGTIDVSNPEEPTFIPE